MRGLMAEPTRLDEARISGITGAAAARSLRRRAVAIVEDVLDATERLVESTRQLGEPARARLYEHRAVYLRDRLAELRTLLEELDQVTASAAAAVERLHTADMPLADGVARLIADLPKDVGLTPREREVLGLIVRGYTNRQIAAKLVITPGTTANHVANILAKLNCRNRAQAVVTVLGQPARLNSEKNLPDSSLAS